MGGGGGVEKTHVIPFSFQYHLLNTKSHPVTVPPSILNKKINTRIQEIWDCSKKDLTVEGKHKAMESSIWMRNVFMEALDNYPVVSCPFQGSPPPLPLGPPKKASGSKYVLSTLEAIE